MSYKQDNGYGSGRKQYRSFDWEFAGVILFVVAVIVAILGSIVWAIVWSNTTGTAESCLVKDKTASSKSKGGTDYRIYTDKCGVLTVGDDMFKGKFNSADRYSELEIGKTYNFDTVGWRFDVVSAFPNILELHEVK